MRGVIHPLPNTPSWRGAQLKAKGQLYLYHMELIKLRNTNKLVHDIYIYIYIYFREISYVRLLFLVWLVLKKHRQE
jgi:hypothetical protein